MIIDRNLKPYVIFYKETISRAIERIVKERESIICAVDEHNHMYGLFTNGDFLRWLINNSDNGLNNPVSDLINKNYIYAREDDSPEKIERLLDKVQYVPIIDQQQHLTAIARRRTRKIKLDSFTISEEESSFIIAEIGINHNGNLEIAKQLVDEAVLAGANCAKFQMRDMSTLYINQGNPNDVRENLGAQYTLDILSRFQLSNSEMFEVFDYCKEKGILPLCTPWDLNTLRLLEDYGMPAYKVASADMTNHELLRALGKIGKPLICSTGMSDEEEIIDTVKLLKSLGMQYILLQCNSTYPAPFKDINLKYLNRLIEIGDCIVGYSGHERGICVPIAAVARGAKVIEKHITLDRDMEGNDHKVSLLPHEFKTMVDGIRQVEQALGTDGPRRITQGERMNRATLAKSLVINRDLKSGQIITAEMIEVRSPGRGLQPNRLNELIGQAAQRDFRQGDFFYPADLEVKKGIARDYRFDRPWGVPVRYHDFKQILAKSNPDFLEFHLSYKDMDQSLDQFFDKQYDLDLVVHSPDLFRGDHLLNLASDDEAHRRRSISELQRVVEITKELKRYFKRAERPLIVASLGGFSKEGFVSSDHREAMYANIADSLSQIEMDGVEIVGQTLPPFPWYFGGQLYLNLFVDPADTAAFCYKYGYRLCLDISHSQLACNQFRWSMAEFVDQIAPYIAHLHIVDAEGVDSEGLQIGEGSIDFAALSKQLREVAPKASFIPEVWQGHENEGEGFWFALKCLEKWF